MTADPTHEAREVLAAHLRADGFEQLALGIEQGQSPTTIRAMLAFRASRPAMDREAVAEARSWLEQMALDNAADAQEGGQFDHALNRRVNTALAALSTREAVADDGFVRVPREPTEAMLDEACGVSIAVYPTNIPRGWTATNHDEARAIWEAMLAKAAAPPALALSAELGGEGPQ